MYVEIKHQGYQITFPDLLSIYKKHNYFIEFNVRQIYRKHALFFTVSISCNEGVELVDMFIGYVHLFHARF